MNCNVGMGGRDGDLEKSCDMEIREVRQLGRFVRRVHGARRAGAEVLEGKACLQ